MNTIKYIEEQILLYSDSTKEKDMVRIQTYLELRKKLLDEQFINHLDEHLSELADFNERMTKTLKNLWDDAQKCFATFMSMEGFDIEVCAFLELDAKKENCENSWFEIYCLLSDPSYNPGYHSGVCLSPIILKSSHKPLLASFDEFIGNDGQSWNEDLPDSHTKGIPLTMMFHHIYDHTYWSLYDMLKIQHFNAVLNSTFEKVI